MNKSSGDYMKSKGLLIRESNDHRGRSKEKDGKSDNRERSKSRSCKDVECYYYHKKGQIKKNCQKFKVNQEEVKKPENTSTAGVAMENKAELFSVSSGKPISDS